jgi:lysophospholipase L1-like esterase
VAGSAPCAPLHSEFPRRVPADVSGPAVEIENPDGALSRYFQHTSLLLRGRRTPPVRIAVYGDSNGTMDVLSGQMRRTLQSILGDAGHGFHALARPWPWYQHQDVAFGVQTDAWEAYTVSTHPTPRSDLWYGTGLIAAESRRPGATSWIGTAPEDSLVGTRASRFEVYYLARPKGGSFEVRVDGESRATVSTDDRETAHFAFVGVDVPEGPHKMKIVVRSARSVRLLGAVIEREGPGVQVDGLGVGSLNCACLLRESEELDREILEHRPYDLVVFHIGTNAWGPSDVDRVTCMSSVIARWRRSIPDVSTLIMTPPDWGADGALKTPGWLLRVGSDLHSAAEQTKSAFFDFRLAMGGDGSMAHWEHLRMTQGDGVHLNAKGGALASDLVTDALGRAFENWALQHPDAGCE